MKKYALSAALAVVLGLGAFGIADAQRRGPGGDFRGRDPFLSGVDLTDAQREQIRAIHEQERASAPQHAASMPLHVQLRTELLADSPDQQRIAALREQIVAAESERLTHEIAVQQKIAAVLTPEQRAKARDALVNAGERRHEKPRW